MLFGQIGRGDHAGDALAVKHRHMMDVVARHEQQGVERRIVQVHEERRQRGDVHDRSLRVQPCCNHAVAQVAVGDQPEEMVLFQDQDG